MGKNKIRRFAENETFPHVFQPSFEESMQGGFPLKGKWQEDFFHNENPLTLELGCGKGEYTVTLAQRFPERNYIGLDIKGARIWRGAKTVQENQLKNVAFLRIRIDQVATFFAAHDKVSEIWITFPDPQLRDGHAKKRLTSPQFLKRYRQFATPGCIIHLKTDSPELYAYTNEVIEEEKLKVITRSTDIDKDFPNDEILGIRTFYEKNWRGMGMKIFYVSFVLS